MVIQRKVFIIVSREIKQKAGGRRLRRCWSRVFSWCKKKKKSFLEKATISAFTKFKAEYHRRGRVSSRSGKSMPRTRIIGTLILTMLHRFGGEDHPFGMHYMSTFLTDPATCMPFSRLYRHFHKQPICGFFNFEFSIFFTKAVESHRHCSLYQSLVSPVNYHTPTRLFPSLIILTWLYIPFSPTFPHHILHLHFLV